MDIQKEREAFSRWVLTHPDNLDITSYEENIMFDAWQAAKAQAIPEGFVVVPKEPTDEMIDAGHDFCKNNIVTPSGFYKAMIEAQEQSHD